MTAFDDFSELFRNPAEILAAHQEQLRKAEELQQQVLELKGTAASDDERITVSFSHSGGVEELALDPRALRMPSEELADEIRRLINQARDDVQRQTEAITREAFAEGATDPGELVEQLPQMQQQMDEMLRDTRTAGNEIDDMLERMRAMFPDADGSPRQ